MPQSDGFPVVSVSVVSGQVLVHGENCQGGLVQVLGLLQAGIATASLQLSRAGGLPIRAGKEGLFARAPIQARRVS